MPTFTLKQIANLIDAKVQGDEHCLIHDIAPIESAQSGELTFIFNLQYRKFLNESAATAVLIPSSLAKICNKTALVVNNPKLCLAQLIPLFRPPPLIEPFIHPTAIIGKRCEIGKNVSLGAYSIIEDEVHIGENTVIEASTIIGAHSVIGKNCILRSKIVISHHSVIGDRVVIHNGVIIGADGFGFAMDNKRWVKIPQVANVKIGNDVEIGANTTVDRGMLTDTIICDGVKIDNQVQIAHNVIIGENTIIAGCTGIAGSTKIGANCIIGGGACIADHLEITDNVVIGGMGAVGQSVDESGVYSSGIGILKNKEWRRNMLRFQQLDEMAKRIRRLEEKEMGNSSN